MGVLSKEEGVVVLIDQLTGAWEEFRVAERDARDLRTRRVDVAWQTYIRERDAAGVLFQGATFFAYGKLNAAKKAVSRQLGGSKG
jgi:hypothetical protein